MAEGWKSDWEKLFAKCAADEDYCRRLASALDKNHDGEVRSLLANIGAIGASEAETAARVSVLKGARVPLTQVASTFAGGPGDFVAP